jgi:hypothetical protein
MQTKILELFRAMEEGCDFILHYASRTFADTGTEAELRGVFLQEATNALKVAALECVAAMHEELHRWRIPRPYMLLGPAGEEALPAASIGGPPLPGQGAAVDPLAEMQSWLTEVLTLETSHSSRHLWN